MLYSNTLVKVLNTFAGKTATSKSGGRRVSSYLDIMQDLAEDGPLLASVIFGPMFISVCCQTLQTLAQHIAILILKLLNTGNTTTNTHKTSE